MSVMTLEGVIENGHIRLLTPRKLPESSKVYVVVPDVESPAPRVHSPRLADPEQLPRFVMEMKDLREE